MPSWTAKRAEREAANVAAHKTSTITLKTCGHEFRFRWSLADEPAVIEQIKTMAADPNCALSQTDAALLIYQIGLRRQPRRAR